MKLYDNSLTLDVITEYLVRGDYLFHASPIQNLNRIKPMMKTRLKGVNKPVVYASNHKGYASTFSFEWNDSDNIKSGTIKNAAYILIPISLQERLENPASLYLVDTGSFEQINELEYVSYTECKIIKELKYETAISCIQKCGAIIKWLNI